MLQLFTRRSQHADPAPPHFCVSKSHSLTPLCCSRLFLRPLEHSSPSSTYHRHLHLHRRAVFSSPRLEAPHSSLARYSICFTLQHRRAPIAATRIPRRPAPSRPVPPRPAHPSIHPSIHRSLFSAIHPTHHVRFNRQSRLVPTSLPPTTLPATADSGPDSSFASFAFPIFASYKALKANDPAQLTPWIMYWVVLACAVPPC